MNLLEVGSCVSRARREGRGLHLEERNGVRDSGHHRCTWGAELRAARNEGRFWHFSGARQVKAAPHQVRQQSQERGLSRRGREPVLPQESAMPLKHPQEVMYKDRKGTCMAKWDTKMAKSLRRNGSKKII